MTVHADEKLWPNTELNIYMEGQFGQPKETLIERMDRVNPELRAILRKNTQLIELRKHARSINGMPGQEYAAAFHFPQGVAFDFMAENRMVKKQMSLLRPSMSLRLELGGLEKPSPLSADQANKLWDGLLNSLRLSPANGGARVDPASNPGNFKPTAKVGQQSPRDGWWRAGLPPGHRSAHLLDQKPYVDRQLKKGDLMPEVYAQFMSPNADADNAQIIWRWLHA